MLLGSAYVLQVPPVSLAGVSLILLALVVLAGVLFVARRSESFAGLGRQASTGAEGMVGEIGVVREPVGAGSPGWVCVHGELWRAEVALAPEESYERDHEQAIGVGRKVQVVQIKDGKVVVLPLGVAGFERSLES